MECPVGLSTLAERWSFRTPSGEAALMKITSGRNCEVRSSFRAYTETQEKWEWFATWQEQLGGRHILSANSCNDSIQSLLLSIYKHSIVFDMTMAECNKPCPQTEYMWQIYHASFNILVSVRGIITLQSWPGNGYNTAYATIETVLIKHACNSASVSELQDYETSNTSSILIPLPPGFPQQYYILRTKTR